MRNATRIRFQETVVKYIGKETQPVDGIAKVTGRAKYAVEFQMSDCAYGYIVTNLIAESLNSRVYVRRVIVAPLNSEYAAHQERPAFVGSSRHSDRLRASPICLMRLRSGLMLLRA